MTEIELTSNPIVVELLLVVPSPSVDALLVVAHGSSRAPDCLDGHADACLWEALLAAGAVGFACPIGVHYLIGYLDPVHLAPAWADGVLFIIGIILSWHGYWKAKL